MLEEGYRKESDQLLICFKHFYLGNLLRNGPTPGLSGEGGQPEEQEGGGEAGEEEQVLLGDHEGHRARRVGLVIPICLVLKTKQKIRHWCYELCEKSARFFLEIGFNTIL